MNNNMNGIAQSVKRFGTTQPKAKRASKAYTRYFEGYSEFTAKPDRPGKKGKIVRVYTADFYAPEGSAAFAWGRKALLLLLAGMSAAVFVFTALRPNILNTAPLVTLPQCVCVFFLGRMLLSALRYFVSGRLMTIYAYKVGPEALKKASRGTCVCLSVLALSCAVMLAAAGGHPGEIVRAAAGYLISGLLAGAVRFIESKTRYSRVPGTKMPEGAGEFIIQEG